MAAGLLVVAGGQSGAGHSIGHFPSYYPDEIRIDAIDAAAAAAGLGDGTLHAYVGAAPAVAAPVPGHVAPVTSLGSFLVLAFDTASARFAAADARCAAARGILAALRDDRTAGFVFHPYPVTPYHADYLHHLDRVEAARGAAGGGSPPAATATVGAKGRLPAAIVQARWGRAADGGDVVLEDVPVDALFADGAPLGGRPGPPWMKEGWHQAYRLLAQGVDGAARAAVDDDHGHLSRGETIGLAERVDLERRLVAALTDGCARLVVGYAPRAEYVNTAYPAGIENVAFDSLGGLDSPVFIRTVKLKEYPWNGKLQLGVRDDSAGAWNPVAGFTDAMGRLVWAAIGDPAMIPFPFNASWMPNRVQAEVTKLEGQSGGIAVPADAVRPQPGTGTLQRVGAGTYGSAKVVYEVLASPFEDGTETEAADLIYPFVLAARWGSDPAGGENVREPRLEPMFTTMREHLAGLRIVRVENTKHAVAEGWDVLQKTPVVEVYLRGVPRDETQTAALMPPWSPVPWHLLVLMEEAVIRGHAAFSQEEAQRRRVPWLDLVRDDAIKPRLRDLIARFERERYRPEPLQALVTADAAQARWRSLGAFFDKSGHFLVANGPYRLADWKQGSVVLQAVREVTYPLGFGTFDRFVDPPRAVIEAVAQDSNAITIRASAEMTAKMGRGYQLVTEPLLRTTMRGTFGMLVVSRYLLIGPDGAVIEVDKMRWGEDGRFTIDLPDRLPPGQYTVNLAIFLDGNSMHPSARTLRVRIGEPRSPPG